MNAVPVGWMPDASTGTGIITSTSTSCRAAAAAALRKSKKQKAPPRFWSFYRGPFAVGLFLWTFFD
jgi:hypothetical protein